MTDAAAGKIVKRRTLMLLVGTELLDVLADQPSRTIKFLMNDAGIAFFPASQQHRESKFPGLSYKDDTSGNALAGVLNGERIDIRFHSAFVPDRVRLLWARIRVQPQLSHVRDLPLYYQGKLLSPPRRADSPFLS